MNITDLQKLICKKLNADPILVNGGAHAMIQDSLDIEAEINNQLDMVGGVAIVTVPGNGARVGANTKNGLIPLEYPNFAINCVEVVALNRARVNAITAAQAAQRVIALMDCPAFLYVRHSESPDEQRGELTTSVFFKTTATIHPIEILNTKN